MQREPHAGESAPNRFDPGRWSEALSAAGVAVLVLDAGLRLVGVTPGRGSAWGLGPEDVGHALSPERHGTLRAWLEGAVGSLLGDGVAVEREVRDPAGGRVLARAAAIDGSGHVAVVLLDLTMPRMDVVETGRRMREIAPGVSLVLSSGYPEEDAMDRFGALGISDFLQKPYEPETLARVVRQALRTRGESPSGSPRGLG